MLTLIFAKIASDLAVYYTFAAFCTCFFGLDGLGFLPVLLLQSLGVTLSWLLRERGGWRLVPTALGLLALLWPGLWPAGVVAALPAAAYGVYLAARSLYVPDWGRQQEIFSAFWRLAVGFGLLAALFGKTDWLLAASLPYAVTALTLSVVLTRSLRHDPEIYCAPRYQAVNLLLVCAVLALAFSSNAVVALAVELGRLLYAGVLRPLLTLLYAGGAAVGKAAALLIEWIKRLPRRIREVETAQPSPTPAPTGTWPMGEPVEPTEYAPSEVWTYLTLAFTALVAAAIVLVLFRLLSARGRAGQGDGAYRETRGAAPRRERAAEEPPTQAAAAQVRAQYKKFLRLTPVRARHTAGSDTSWDINAACAGRLDDDAAAELRELYLRARYDGVAAKRDAARAKELYRILKRSAWERSGSA